MSDKDKKEYEYVLQLTETQIESRRNHVKTKEIKINKKLVEEQMKKILDPDFDDFDFIEVGVSIQGTKEERIEHIINLQKKLKEIIKNKKQEFQVISEAEYNNLLKLKQIEENNEN